MKRLFSNGPSKDFVVNPFKKLLQGSQRAFIAAPFVNKTNELLTAAREGTRISLLAGLNVATSPEALKAVHGHANVAVRYLTRRFHAKIYIFDSGALVGSSNLTDGGLISNREATIWLDPAEDSDRIDEVQALFADLWESAQVLTTEKLRSFSAAHG